MPRAAHGLFTLRFVLFIACRQEKFTVPSLTPHCTHTGGSRAGTRTMLRTRLRPAPCSPPPLGRAELRRPWGPRNSLPPSEGAGRRRTPRAPLFPSHSGHSSHFGSLAGRATRGMPRAPDPGAKTNLRGAAAHAARWGGAGQTTGIGFLRSPSLQRAPPQPTRALGLGFDAWGHSLTPAKLVN